MRSSGSGPFFFEAGTGPGPFFAGQELDPRPFFWRLGSSTFSEAELGSSLKPTG